MSGVGPSAHSIWNRTPARQFGPLMATPCAAREERALRTRVRVEWTPVWPLLLLPTETAE